MISSENTSLVCVSDFEQQALKVLDSNAKDYYRSGADDEQSLYDNTRDFKRYRLRPKMMINVSKIKLNTSILGNDIAFPIGISPTAMQKMAHPEGEVANAKAAATMNTCYTLSTIATTGAIELAEAVPGGLKWLQLYIFKDRSITRELVERVEKAGYKALVLTVDTPIFGSRRADIRNKFRLPPHLRMANFIGLSSSIAQEMNKKVDGSGLSSFSHKLFDSSLTWSDVKWLKSITRLPVVAKGILTGDDAIKAIDAGCDAVLVSNHGARQLDGVTSTILALPEVVKAVQGRVEIYLDGGIRTGTDVLKAIALGARAVFIGRPALYGLAVNGEEGVIKILSILKDELSLAMKLAGVVNIQNIPDRLVVHEDVYSKL